MKSSKVILSLASVATLVSCGIQSNESISKTQAIQPYEDCVSFNYATAQLQNVGGSWKIVDGGHYLFDFGANFGEAQKSLQIIKNGQARYSCFVKRPNAKFKYLLNSAGNAIRGNLHAQEDCIAFNPSAVGVQLVGSSWRLVQGSMSMLDFGPGPQGQQQANTTRAVIQSKGFTQQCFVGRPNPSFTYWKAPALTPPPAPVALTTANCTDHMASAGSLFQCPADKVVTGLFDRIQPTGQFETIRCCSLKAAGAAVAKVGGVSDLGIGYGAASVCPGNTFLTGVSYTPAGALQGVRCQGLASSGRSVVKTGVQSQQVLYGGAGDSCQSQSIGVGVADTVAVDGTIDNIRCQRASRL